jgi:hypothetical protein
VIPFLLGYLAMGVVVCAGIFFALHFAKGRNPRAEGKTETRESPAPKHSSRWPGFKDRVIVPVLVASLVIVFWPVALYWKVKDQASSEETEQPAGQRAFRVARKDLLKRLALEDIERDEMLQDPLGAVPNLPFGHLNPAWQKFKSCLLPDDEVWAFAAVRPSDGGRKNIARGM